MSKYDFEIDLSLNSSSGIILSKLRPDSTILEFGCATGRMTRYMKEVLGCSVYIVEYDRDAFQRAIQFAEDGICDDIQNYLWSEQFGAIAFDAILFADVLEHLTQPEEVLKKAAALLKEDGCIYGSIPNITHNDIVLKFYEERFDYTQTGLLDDTHVHFWGLENIMQCGRIAGLTVKRIEGTHCPVGSTEQNIQLGKNLLLENILRERRAGEVYQFVVTMDKCSNVEPECTICSPAIMSHIYLDTGKDFNSEERNAVASSYSGHGSYITHFVIADVKNICRVRLDPVEHQGVILRRISIRQNGEEKPIFAPSAVQTNGGMFLTGDDPMVFAQVQPEQGPVSVDAEFILPGADYLHILEETVRTEYAILADSMQQSRNEIQDLRKAVSNLNKEIAERKQALLTAQEENRQLQTDVCAYIILANQKEKIALTLEKKQQVTEQRLVTMEMQRNEYVALAAKQNQYITELEAALEYYRNLRYVKLRAFAVRALWKIKSCVKKLLGRVN